MYNDNAIANKNNNRKKRNSETEFKADPIVLKMLSDNYIHAIQKPSAKFPKAKFICKICPYHIADIDKAIKHSSEAMHKNNFKRTCARNMMQYIHEPTASQLEAINDCLNNTLVLNIFISEAEANRRKELFNEMNTLASGRLSLCGSLVTGMSMIDISDVNLYLELNGNNASYLSELQELSTVFAEKLSLTTDLKLEKNNCGLFCKDYAGVSYHISASTRMCQLSSALIAVYQQVDERAEKLIRLFRYFAKQAFIDRYVDGLIPVHVFHLLVVFYLQQLPVPVLPNLHRLAETNPDLAMTRHVTTVIVNDTRIHYVSDIDTVHRLWTPPTNPATLAQLWVGLLRFYAIDFDSNQYMVSVRCTEPLLKIDRNIANKRLAVDDPFDFKRNLLFGYNSTDVVDFFNDQLQGCYIYFAIPQLISGPAFSKVNFMEMTLQSMADTCLVTPTFVKDEFAVSIGLIEAELRILYESETVYYDVSKWPVRLFVKLCLKSILTSVFDSRLEIESFVTILDVKGSSYFSIGSYANFREHAMHLAMCFFKDSSDYFEATGSWSKPDIDSREAYEIIKRATQKFITESLNITLNDDENDDEEYEMHDNESIEAEIEEILEDLAITIEDGTDELDIAKSPNHKVEETKTIKSTTDLENWKMPIAFKLIYLPIKGILESSNEIDVYNEHRVQSISKDQMNYGFPNIAIHKNKLEIVCTFCNGRGHRKECCRDAIPRFEDIKYILRDVNSTWLLKLNDVLVNKYESTLPTKERLHMHEKIFNDINHIIKNLYSNARPQMFGSSNNGFMTRASDIDICLEFFTDDNKRQQLSNKDITTRLKSIGRDLKKCMAGIEVSYVLKAKVPIIKFYFRDNVQGDISINNSLAIHNTRMLKVYADIYPNMKALGNLLKFMSKSCDIGDASQGTLSSYAYIVMLIHFLQKRGLLPVLQELYENGVRPSNIIDGWDAWYQSNMELIYKLWKPKPNAVSFEYLWLDFFYYYAVEFDIDKEVVSIRQSKPLYKIDKGWLMSYMAIEDPFDLNHNLSGSLSLDKCRLILQCFAHVLKLHCNNDNLERKDNFHYMLMEPSTLRPPFANTTRTCFKCNKQGHVARDCTEGQYHRNPATNVGSVQRDLSNRTAPFQYKESTTSNLIYMQIDQSESASNLSIPLKTFNGSINDFSVVPISVNIGDKSILIPMLVSKDDRINDRLNQVIKNGQNNLYSLPFEVTTSAAKMPGTPQRYNANTIIHNNTPLNSIPMNAMPINSNPTNIQTWNTAVSNNNQKKPNNKKPSTPVQSTRLQQHEPQQFMNRFAPPTNQNFSPNQGRFMVNNPAQNNMANVNRHPGFNGPQSLQYGPPMPRQFMAQQKQYQQYQQEQYQHGQPNSRQTMTPNNGNIRYPLNKGNK